MIKNFRFTDEDIIRLSKIKVLLGLKTDTEVIKRLMIDYLDTNSVKTNSNSVKTDVKTNDDIVKTSVKTQGTIVEPYDPTLDRIDGFELSLWKKAGSGNDPERGDWKGIEMTVRPFLKRTLWYGDKYFDNF